MPSHRAGAFELSDRDMVARTKFHVGRIVHHRRFDCQGVVIDVAPEFGGSDGWYDSVARTYPGCDQPWYRIVADGAEQETCVARMASGAGSDW